MKTRAKFVVTTVELQNHKLFADNDTSRTSPIGFAARVKLAAQYDLDKSPEDVSFSEATPSGTIEIYVSNPAVAGTFKPGDAYYIDFTPVGTA